MILKKKKKKKKKKWTPGFHLPPPRGNIHVYYRYIQTSSSSGDGNDMNPALPDTSMKLGRYVYKHKLFEIFSLANQNYSNFQDGGSKFQDGCQNIKSENGVLVSEKKLNNAENNISGLFANK